MTGPHHYYKPTNESTHHFPDMRSYDALNAGSDGGFRPTHNHRDNSFLAEYQQPVNGGGHMFDSFFDPNQLQNRDSGFLGDLGEDVQSEVEPPASFFDLRQQADGAPGYPPPNKPNDTRRFPYGDQSDLNYISDQPAMTARKHNTYMIPYGSPDYMSGPRLPSTPGPPLQSIVFDFTGNPPLSSRHRSGVPRAGPKTPRSRAGTSREKCKSCLKRYYVSQTSFDGWCKKCRTNAYTNNDDGEGAPSSAPIALPNIFTPIAPRQSLGPPISNFPTPSPFMTPFMRPDDGDQTLSGSQENVKDNADVQYQAVFSSPAEARKHLSPTKIYTKLEIVDDDIDHVDHSMLHELASKMFDKILDMPAAAPGGMSDKEKGVYATQQKRAHNKCRVVLSSADGVKNASARTLLACQAAVVVHTVGIPSVTSVAGADRRNGYKLDGISKFTDRVTLMTDAVADNKLVAYDVLFGIGLEDFAAAPFDYLKRKITNFRGNDTKRHQYEIARQRQKSNRAEGIEGSGNYGMNNTSASSPAGYGSNTTPTNTPSPFDIYSTFVGSQPSGGLNKRKRSIMPAPLFDIQPSPTPQRQYPMPLGPRESSMFTDLATEAEN